MLGTLQRLALEGGESLCDVARHGHVNDACVEVPIRSETEVMGVGGSD
jgi:hypothetical protein